MHLFFHMFNNKYRKYAANAATSCCIVCTLFVLLGRNVTFWHFPLLLSVELEWNDAEHEWTHSAWLNFQLGREHEQKIEWRMRRHAYWLINSYVCVIAIQSLRSDVLNLYFFTRALDQGNRISTYSKWYQTDLFHALHQFNNILTEAEGVCGCDRKRNVEIY